MMAMMQWSSALEALRERIGPRFARSEGTHRRRTISKAWHSKPRTVVSGYMPL